MSRQPQTIYIYLLCVGSDHFVMRSAYAWNMCLPLCCLNTLEAFQACCIHYLLLLH